MSSENLIEFQEVSKHFPGTVALDKVSFSIRRGEIHSVVGANGAGKSTLMNILGGQYKNDGGTIIFDDEPMEVVDPQHSIETGISIVYQELKLCDNLNVTQNIFLGKELRSFGKIKWREMEAKADELLKSLEAGVDPKRKVDDLTVGKKQLVEIAKALSLQSKVIILDEPTSALSMKDSENLFENIFKLKKKGVTVIFISHRMEEVFKISDRITVLRDGKYFGTYIKDEVKPAKIVDLIAGKSLSEELSRHSELCNSEEVVLEVKNLSRGRYFSGISFKLFRGEFLGIYGLQGAGRTELFESIFGLEKPDSGEIIFNDGKLQIKSPIDAIEAGMVMVPEDRRGRGIFPNMDVKENICSVAPDNTVKAGFLMGRQIAGIAREYVDKIGIKVTGVGQKIVNLSGGNQQKAIIAKWLTKKPKLLLLDEVTRGIDVGAKAEIFKLLRQLVGEGISIILVSSEIDEILAECDRTLVMWNGKIVQEFTCDKMERQPLLAAAMGL